MQESELFVLLLLKASVGRGDGAGLESAEAGGCAVPGCSSGLHRPHQLLPWLHPGSHPGACGCICHTAPPKVMPTLWILQLSTTICQSNLTFFFFSNQGPHSLHPRHAQPSLHAPFFRLFLSRATGSSCQFPGWLVALPVSHLAGNPGPLPVWLSGLPTHSPAGLSLLATFLEHPLLEVNAGHTGLWKVQWVKSPFSGCLHFGKCERQKNGEFWKISLLQLTRKECSDLTFYLIETLKKICFS